MAWIEKNMTDFLLQPLRPHLFARKLESGLRIYPVLDELYVMLHIAYVLNMYYFRLGSNFFNLKLTGVEGLNT